MTTTAQFEVGKTYATRSICDHDCIFSFTILARTAKTVTVEVHGKTVRRGVSAYAGIEQFKPFGNYSMCAIITAEKVAVSAAKLPTATIETDEGDVEVALPFKWVICGHCRGHGTSSAYLGAITQADREPGGTWEDPEEFADYMAGRYDRECDRCGGSGKVAVVDRERAEPEHLKAWDAECQAEREIRAAEAAERRMGA
jgi:hypothetical protein